MRTQKRKRKRNVHFLWGGGGGGGLVGFEGQLLKNMMKPPLHHNIFLVAPHCIPK